MAKIIHLVAGGPVDLIPDLKQFDSEDIEWVGVDRGVYILIQNQLQPSMAVGDFDSVSEVEWNMIKQSSQNLKQFKPEKDETDLEIALNWAIAQQPKSIRIFGATGGRLDHFIGCMYMLSKNELLHSKVTISIIDKTNELTVYTPGTYQITSAELKYVSFFSVNEAVDGLTLVGFKYPITSQRIIRGSTLCISNELVEEKGTFSFDTGILMMVRSADE